MLEILNADAMEYLKTMESETVDLILTDPPYYTPAKISATRARFRRSLGDFGILDSWFSEFIEQAVRVMKATGRLYIFCDSRTYPLFYFRLYKLVRDCRALIWDKKVSYNGYTCRRQHELILYAEMPAAPKIPSANGDVFKKSAVSVKVRKQPAEKPVELIQQLMAKVTSPGDLVLDPFCGSGTSAIAAVSLKLRYIGVDISSEFCQMTQERVAGTRQGGLFNL